MMNHNMYVIGSNYIHIPYFKMYMPIYWSWHMCVFCVFATSSRSLGLGVHLYSRT